jgi:WD40 repeat protein
VHELPVNSVAFSPDGKWLATAMQHQIKMWSRQTWGVVHILSDIDSVSGIHFSRDGRRLAADIENYSITLWADPWQRASSKSNVGPDQQSIAFSPDLRYYVVARNDGAILIRKLAQH